MAIAKVLIYYSHELEIDGLRDLLAGTPVCKMVEWRRLGSTESDDESEERPALIVNLGFAGALDPALGLGEVVLVDGVSADGRARQALDRFEEREGLKVVDCATSATPVLDRALAERLREATDAGIVDMELDHVLTKAGALSPIVAFKLISDHCDASAWPNIRRHGRDWSKALGAKVFDFLEIFIE